MQKYILVCTSMYWYVPVHTGMYWNKVTHTSEAWHEVLSVLPHTTTSRTLCKILWAFSKFHLDFSPVLSGRFCWRISSSSTAIWCNSGSSDSGIRDWRNAHALDENTHYLVTGVSNMRQTEQARPSLGIIDCLVDELNLNLVYNSMY